MLNTSRIITSASFRLLRMMSHTTSSESAGVPWKEIRIPVPWGHIAAKEWGCVGKQPVLSIHGWQDNSNSFDLVLPMLRLSDMHVIAVDLPGHGLSSHKPPGMMYHLFDWIIDIRRVITYLGWKQFSILGHSMGAGVGLLYSAIYPSDIKKFVAIDNVRPNIYPLDILTERMERGIEQLFTYEDRVTKPAVSVAKEDAVEMVINAMFGSCNKKSAEILLQRGSRVTEGGRLLFNRDPRLKCNTIPGITKDQLEALIANIRCEYMLIKANDGLFTKFESFGDLDETFDILKKGTKLFEIVEVEGSHHVHLNNPERVAPHINRFLCADIDCAIP